MVKEFFKDKFNIGGDGGTGEVMIGAEAGVLKLRFEAGMPIVKLLSFISEPAKKLIPGDKYDHYVDDLVNALIEKLGDGPVVPPTDV